MPYVFRRALLLWFSNSNMDVALQVKYNKCQRLLEKSKAMSEKPGLFGKCLEVEI